MMWFLWERWQTLVSSLPRGVRSGETWEEGQSMVEYAIIAALIAIAAMGAVQALGGGIAGVFQRILGSIGGIG